jgi:manganese/iron transport system permease protein
MGWRESRMDLVLTWLTEPFQNEFMLRGLGASLIVGVVVPVMGTYVVLRGLAFFGDALAHIILPGVVIALLLGWSLLWGALIAGVLAALTIGAITRNSVIREDTAIGVVFAGVFAIGVAMVTMRGGDEEELTHILFGDLLNVTAADLALIGVLALVVLIIMVAFYKEFMVLSFDRVLATTMQLPVSFLQNLLLVLLAVVVVISLKAVGVSLALAMLVTPPAAAYLLARRLPFMMLISAGFGAISSIIGLYLAFYVNLPSGPAIVIVATIIFALVFLFAPSRGLLRRSFESEPL